MSDSLQQRIARNIAINGPLPVAEFMHWAMADPKDGYYTTRHPIGKDGDFITSPEVSQMFGELIGVWAMSTWQALGRPKQFNLVEIGPGNGTLMSDLLRAAKSNADFTNAAEYFLVETSETLIETQRKTLSEYGKIKWVKSVRDLPAKPTILFANELLDVLPMRQYVKDGDDWHERCVGLDENDHLCWVLGTGKLSLSDLPDGHEDEPDGAVYEISSIREAFVENIADHIVSHGGVALFIDYGHGKTGFGDTFQAVKSHKTIDPLETPGSADLTSHVDFEALAAIAQSTGANIYPLLRQGEFLLALGLLERAGRLGSGQSKEIQTRLTGEVERLALPDKMGDLFKVFAFSASPLNLPPFTGNE